jgi:hypothetical protein
MAGMSKQACDSYERVDVNQADVQPISQDEVQGLPISEDGEHVGEFSGGMLDRGGCCILIPNSSNEIYLFIEVANFASCLCFQFCLAH